MQDQKVVCFQKNIRFIKTYNPLFAAVLYLNVYANIVDIITRTFCSFYLCILKYKRQTPMIIDYMHVNIGAINNKIV